MSIKKLIQGVTGDQLVPAESAGQQASTPPTTPEPPKVSPAATPANPRPLPGTWEDLIDRADVIMTEVGDLARRSANASLESSFWCQDLDGFQKAVVRMEGFVRAIKRARHLRLYETDPAARAWLDVLDCPESLEAFDDRTRFLQHVRILWDQYVKTAGVLIAENHPELF